MAVGEFKKPTDRASTWNFSEESRKIPGHFTTSEGSCSSTIFEMQKSARVILPSYFHKESFFIQKKKKNEEPCKKTHQVCFRGRTECGLHNCLCVTRLPPEHGSAASEFLDFSNQISTIFSSSNCSQNLFLFPYPTAACFLDILTQ